MKELIASIKTIERAYKQVLEYPEIINAGIGPDKEVYALLRTKAFIELSSGQCLKYEHLTSEYNFFPHYLSFKIDGMKFVGILSDEELLERYGVEARQTYEIEEAV